MRFDRLQAARWWLPHHHEGITDIFVRETPVGNHNIVHYLPNTVDKNHHVFLQALGGSCEVTDVTEAENEIGYFPFYHRIDFRCIRVVCNVVLNGLCARFTVDLEQKVSHLTECHHEVLHLTGGAIFSGEAGQRIR